jgi:UDP-N-acetylmuramoyl-tripeptide--D-alanyl-D-alanine ligase
MLPKSRAASHPTSTACHTLPLIQVAHTQRALAKLASAWLLRCHPFTVAVTGSTGKTTVKEMLAAILTEKGQTQATRGNFNNEIGVPLTLLAIQPDDAFAVIEMGANHLGEIARLSALVRPDVALISNAGCAHIEGFGSAENVAKAKGEIFSGLKATGTALINADDRFASYWLGLTAGYNTRTFSLQSSTADFFASAIESDETGCYRFVLHSPAGEISVSLPMPGKHNVMNALAAAAAAWVAGASLLEIQSGLAKVAPISGRLNRFQLGNLWVIDDTYNANPVSIRAAVDLLAEMRGPHWLVLGDMAELGVHATTMHSEVGEYVARTGIETLVTIGKHAADTLAGFNSVRVPGQKGIRCQDIPDVVQQIQQGLPAGTLLVKGSRSAGMERVVAQLRGGLSGVEGSHSC